MIRLVIKDFQANKIYLSFTVLLLFLISTGFMFLRINDYAPEVELYILVALISCSVAAKLFIVINEQYKTDKLFVSLPVSRNQLVKARYLSSIIMIIIGLTVHLSIVMIFGQFQEIADQYSLAILYKPALWVILGILLVVGNNLSYPFHFKFGFYLGSVISLLVQLTLLLLILFISQFDPVQKIFNQFWELFADQKGILIMVELCLLFCFITWLSLKISFKSFKSKDL